MDTYTRNGVRDDLNNEVVKIARNDEFIGGLIMPVELVAEKSGKIFVATKAQGAAQTNRNPTAAPETEVLATTPVEYSTGEILGAETITEAEVKSYGGIAAADLNGAAGGVAKVQVALEQGVARTVIPANAATAASADAAIEALQEKIDAFTGYLGRRMVVGSKKAIRLLEANILASTQKDAYKQQVALASIGEANAARRFLTRCAAMAAFLDVDFVLAGRDDCWTKTHTVAAGVYDGDDDDTAADSPILRYKLGPVFGRQLVFLPDPARRKWPYEIRSFPDFKTLCNLYYARAWVDVKKFNAGASATVGLYNGDLSDSGSESDSDSE